MPDHLIFWNAEQETTMKPTGMLAILGVAGVTALLCQVAPPAAPRTGPGVQAPQDAKYQDLIKTCKTPPPARGGGAKGGGGGKAPQAKGPAAAPAGPRDYKVAAISGVIAEGQQWKEV